MMRKLLASLGCLCLAASCSSSLSPEEKRDVAFGDITALQLRAWPAQSAYRVDSTASFSYTVRNDHGRDAVIYGAGCIVTLEVQTLDGVTVFPTGARPCYPPIESFRVGARDSVVGGYSMSGALGNPATIGTFALPPGTFRMRIVLQGVTDLTTYNPVSVHSAWSEAFTVTR